jgi:hypothetical protein
MRNRKRVNGKSGSKLPHFEGRRERGIIQLIESGSICCIGPGTPKIIINKGFAFNLFNLKIKSPKISLEKFWAMFLHGALRV